MTKLTIINFSLPDGFESKYDEYMKLIEKYNPYKKSLKKVSSRYNKKTRMNKHKGIKIRFAIAYTLNKIKKEMLLHGTTNNHDSEKEDI